MSGDRTILRGPRFFAETKAQEQGAREAEAIDLAEGQRGWRTVVPAPEGGWNGLHVDAAQRSYNTRPHQLLDVDLRRYGAMVGLGSYQLCLSYEITSSVSNAAVPLVCDVLMGAGGILHSFEVDPNGQAFALPADTARLSLRWEAHRGAIIAPGVINVPEVTALATLIRSGQSIPSRATRTKRAEWLENETQVDLEIPEFAKGFRVFGLGTLPAYTAGGQVLQLEGASRMVDSYPNLERLSRDLCYRPINSRATHLTFLRDPGQLAVEWLVEFTLAFGGAQ